MAVDDRKKGVLIAVLAVICVTPDAMLLRWAREEGASDWQTVFWKLSMMGVLNFIAALWLAGGLRPLLISSGRDIPALAFASMLQVCDQLGFTFSFLKTETARAMLFISLNPVWAALLGCIILGDRLKRRTLALLAAGLCASVLVFVPSFSAAAVTSTPSPAAELPAGHQPQTLSGDLIALGTGLCLASYVTFIRWTSKHRPDAGIDLAPSIGNFVAMGMALPIVLATRGGLTSGIELDDYLPVVGVNSLFMSTFYVGFTIAPRYIPGAEVALILLLETLISPLMVWVRFGDVPSVWTMGGGMILLVALIAHEVAGIIEDRKSGLTPQYTGSPTSFGASERLTASPSLHSSIQQRLAATANAEPEAEVYYAFERNVGRRSSFA
jgi:drug/metabolite transporter (DMT)-like permease